jgi:hypothetical protein
MHRVYEIFEVPPNGSPQKVTIVPGLEFAKLVLQGLAKRTSNECFAADTKTHQLVMQLNVPPARQRRIFQISYDEDEGLRRVELLKLRGYGVISVIGNDAAKVLLSSVQHYDLFIVGHTAPEEARREIVDWLKAQYPLTKVLILKPPDQQVPAADFNVPNEPENWLPIVSTVCERRSSTRCA